MKRKKRFLAVLFFIIVLAGIGWQWFRPSPGPALYPGYVEVEEVTLSFPFPGQVKEVRIQEGVRVDSGQILMVEDTLELHYQRKALQEELEANRQRWNALRVRLQQVNRTLSRLSPLEGSGVSRNDVDQLRAERDALSAETKALQATRRALEARMAALQHRIQEGVLRAPRDAEVIDVWLAEGERAVPGQPALRLGITDTVKVVAFLPEPVLPSVRLGDTLWVRLDDQPHRWIPGVISWISPKAEYASQYVQTPENRVDLVFRIHLRLPNPDGRFHAGLPVDVARQPAF